MQGRLCRRRSGRLGVGNCFVKEKVLTRARDAQADERRPMPWMDVEKNYEFDGPMGKASMLAWAAPCWLTRSRTSLT